MANMYPYQGHDYGMISLYHLRGVKKLRFGVFETTIFCGNLLQGGPQPVITPISSRVITPVTQSEAIYKGYNSHS